MDSVYRECTRASAHPLSSASVVLRLRRTPTIYCAAAIAAEAFEAAALLIDHSFYTSWSLSTMVNSMGVVVAQWSDEASGIVG